MQMHRVEHNRIIAMHYPKLFSSISLSSLIYSNMILFELCFICVQHMLFSYESMYMVKLCNCAYTFVSNHSNQLPSSIMSLNNVCSKQCLRSLVPSYYRDTIIANVGKIKRSLSHVCTVTALDLSIFFIDSLRKPASYVFG